MILPSRLWTIYSEVGIDSNKTFCWHGFTHHRLWTIHSEVGIDSQQTFCWHCFSHSRPLTIHSEVGIDSQQTFYCDGFTQQTLENLPRGGHRLLENIVLAWFFLPIADLGQLTQRWASIVVNIYRHFLGKKFTQRWASMLGKHFIGMVLPIADCGKFTQRSAQILPRIYRYSSQLNNLCRHCFTIAGRGQFIQRH